MNMDATHLVRVIHQETHMPCTGSQNKYRNMTLKVISKTNITSCYQRSRDTRLERHPRSAIINSDGLYVQKGMKCSEIYNREDFMVLGF
ncbi:hypothetical protein M9H77_35214 [Catharanthus roseus]|uniref:Uncharacterized protein n=1 Tax=Catharanthus roseus TaxID=4058 RepID=A0ACB9ZPA3_CATRO|nr:hypothetical protein M9H77_35214 [Catharanthus roseus]